MIEVEDVVNWLREGEDFAAANLLTQCEFSYDYIDFLMPLGGGQDCELYDLRIHAPRKILKNLNSYKIEIEKIESAIKELNEAEPAFYIQKFYWVALKPKAITSQNSSEFHQTVDDYEYMGLHGEGYFCIVKKYKNKLTEQCFALKELKKDHYSNDDYRYRLNREIYLLNELQGCENIIELLGSGQDKEKEKFWYLMPFAKQNLFSFIKENNGTILKELKYNLVEQIINAIKFAHNKNILHRDISPNNILVFGEKTKNIILKISDFGLGKNTESLSYYTGSSASGYGQNLYVSPEQKSQLSDATVKSDIFSLGKLVYFIFTGKDPDTLKQFELSSLVTKAIEENPEDRFSNISEFENHFLALRDLQLKQEIPDAYVTLKDVIDSQEKFDWLTLHQLLIEGKYIHHVFEDYISPVNKLLLTNNHLTDYYKIIGNDIVNFVKTYSDRLNVCYKTTYWPFREMSTFGLLLIKIIKTVSDEETKLICFKQLWYLAFETDQWSVQRDMKAVFNDKFISSSIETQLSEYIIKSETKVEMAYFSTLVIPRIIKVAIITGTETAIKKEEERKNIKI